MADPSPPRRRASDVDPAAGRARTVELEALYGALVQALAVEVGQASVLREANERLVVSAMQAGILADSAFTQLDELSHVAGHDSLTGTPNRATMLDRIGNAVTLARRHGARFALVFVDLDGFKAINDRLGHEAGDRALEMAARRLESVVRASDTVSRHGGDEFLVLLPEITGTADAAAIAAKMLEALARPVESPAITLAASLGIALFPEDGEDASALIACADLAMYAAKGRGGGCFEFAPPSEAASAAPDRRGAVASSRERLPPAPARELCDLREANQRLVIAALAAQEAEAACAALQRRHADFVSMVAHELRSPLGPLRACADLLGAPSAGDGEAIRVRGILDRQVGQLSRIVGDLAASAHASHGGFQVDRRRIDLALVLDAAVDGCSARMTTRGQSLERLLAGDGLPLWVDGDPVRLGQVFANLLDNASKYTPRGGRVVLSVVAEKFVVAVSVADDGMGIESATLPNVFELFVRDARARDVDPDGQGIGLAVVREIVVAHGATVSVHSDGVGRGSRFDVLLPRRD